MHFQIISRRFNMMLATVKKVQRATVSPFTTLVKQTPKNIPEHYFR